MNTRNSKRHSSESLKEVYQLGYDYGYEDIWENEDYDIFPEYDIHINDASHQRVDKERQGQLWENRGKFISARSGFHENSRSHLPGHFNANRT
ncbi:hypothetical protein HX13_11470 [Chryseobacterium sp. P1-3]|uniref:Uncharacterized protein n=1 Tax=Chryseobacterium gallinarum TaxID=1324352 RepID=A0A0G3M814_CHRGL|nr:MULTISPECIES: hypothetical protein [Chryseobacterium]AKK74103.1 hypothetical protein OK18_17135 [Chryseobacterium gallinarum]KFF74672.1 hypothetical protein HX13_11470 [Chryseobacterium sp. P1-3]MCL8537919.1 hypothetical protein [Chryseobacterium gallinarum]